MSNFFKELKRRNVIKASLAYLVAAWVLLQVFSILLPLVEAPKWVFKTFALLIALLFPLWVVFSWIYEFTSEGIKRTVQVSTDQSTKTITNKRLNIFILIALIVAIFLGITNHPFLDLNNSVDSSGEKMGNSIAVLPFDDMSSDGDSQWFCDGVTEDILTNLSKLNGLKVISRSSVMQYRENRPTTPEIAKALGVSYVLEGSVRKHENRIIITAQLIDANDNHIWAENYNDNFEKVFEIQKDVSRKIVKQLKITLSPAEENILNIVQTNDVEAYEIFLKGRSLADERSNVGLKKSIEMYQQAVELDPEYAEAYAEMALSYFMLSGYGYEKFSDVEDKLDELIKKALEINPNTVRAYTVSGKIDIRHKNWNRAKINFEKAIELNPNDATAHHHYSEFYKYKPIPDYENSLIQINMALKLDPFSMPANKEKLDLLIRMNNIDQAEEYLNKTRFLYTQEIALWHECLINVHRNKDWTEAIRFYELELEKDPDNDNFLRKLAWLNNSILKDRKKAIEYSKLARELNAVYNNTYALCWFLMLDQQWEEAEKILNEENFGNEEKIIFQMDEMYLTDQPEKALEFYFKLNNKNTEIEVLYLSRMGEKEKIKELFNDFQIRDFTKARVYANLNERDSMYYYLNKVRPAKAALDTGYDIEFVPYEKEERYKEYLKKNYLPLTARNE